MLPLKTKLNFDLSIDKAIELTKNDFHFLNQILEKKRLDLWESGFKATDKEDQEQVTRLLEEIDAQQNNDVRLYREIIVKLEDYKTRLYNYNCLEDETEIEYLMKDFIIYTHGLPNKLGVSLNECHV